MSIGTYVLMIAFLHGHGGRPFIAFQEFTTKERCEAAGRELKPLFAISDDERKFNGFRCVPK